MRSSGQQIKVTIIVPVLNAHKTVINTLDSIRRLKTDEIELIVLDGGSTDGTKEILQVSFDVVDVLRCERDKGIYDAMNKGVALARGSWCLFLGADDILLDGFSDAVRALLISGYNYYGNVKLASSGRIYNNRYSYIKLLGSNLPHQALFYWVDTLRNNAFDLRYKYLADYANNLLLYPKSPFRYVDCVVALYDNQTGLSSTQRDDAFRREKSALVRRSGWRLAFLYCAVRNVRAFLGWGFDD